MKPWIEACAQASLSAWVLVGATMGSAQAQDAAALQTRGLAATCASCHGTGGRSVEGAAVPGLAGIPAAYMVEQMSGFKSGARTATVMHQIAKGFNDAQINQLAAYFSAQQK